MKVSPKEIQKNELPEPVKGLIVINETVAQLDFDLTIEDSTLKIAIKGITLGSVPDAPADLQKQKWTLS